jgi:DNA sulfur modification protein DndD
LIQIKKIAMKNFIPYYQVKEFVFGDEPGTTIIYGNNNTGKSSFIKGIRFLLFGTDELQDNPDSRHHKIKMSMNRLAWDEVGSTPGFYVYMDFIYNGKNYELKRECVVKGGLIDKPQSDGDYDCLATLKVDGELLSKAKIQEIINEIIPKNISEFMLFDGENIERYIEILSNDSESGTENKRIKDAINNIIGTPYIDAIKSRLDTIYAEVDKEFQDVTRANNSNDGWRRQVDELNDTIERLTVNKDDLSKEISKIKEEIDQINFDLSEQGRTLKIYKDLDAKIIEQDQVKVRLDNSKSDLKKALLQSIEPLQHVKITNVLESSTKEFEKLESRHNLIIELAKKRADLQNLLTNHTCSFCGSYLDDDMLAQHQKDAQKIDEELKSIKLSTDEENDIKRHKDNQKRLHEILDGITKLDVQTIKDCQSDIYLYQNQVSSLNNEIKVLKTELGEYGDDKGDFFRKQFLKLEKKKANLKESEQTLSDLESDLDKAVNKRQKLLGKIKQTKDMTSLINERKSVDQLREQFSNLKERFVSEMRADVQKNASEIFLKFIEGQNKDIDHLEINENYRVKIVMNDQSVMPIPGTGYNTLLALALIYGLNANSALFGTIFFDAAFSVLQNTYTNNIIKTFNDIAPQLILLVHKDKVDVGNTRRMLGEKLVREYEIYQTDSSFNTFIKEAN